jgi:hypothetical protein
MLTGSMSYDGFNGSSSVETEAARLVLDGPVPVTAKDLIGDAKRAKSARVQNIVAFLLIEIYFGV